ncbi:McrB family protein [Ectopseudomonas guguanensis]|uniref:McrB family protein n=1 Tax=Ectopseudomonas guguanensis TaxID=1198456 RepID=UPI002861575A|nr:AAA family ATPase [Pseudomonas guguanensis]MDR8016374.1 AAA family ATPase [Pseudomonas guguanensis]
MLTEGLISEAALQRVLAEADSPQVRNWVLAVLAAIRERFPRCDFYVLNHSNQSEDEPRIYIGIGVRRPDTASGRNALILVAKNNTAYLGFQRKGQFDEKYRGHVFTERLSAEHHTDLAEVKRWLEQLDQALDTDDRRALQGEARTVDDYLSSDSAMPLAAAVADAPSASTVQPSLNQILFGPPGTGKTYATIDHALAILDPGFMIANKGDDEGARERLKTRFDQLAKEGRVRFVTFHQSFSYEDFVEGLRAGCDDEGQLEYRVEPGVLKRLCVDAERGASAENDPFDKAFERLKDRLESTGERIVAQTVRGRRFAFEYVGGETFRIFPEESQEQKFPYRAALGDIRRLYRTGDKSSMHNASYVQGILQYLRDECGLPEYVAELPAERERPKYVLIIDEINRGNVSRIFGELITLIEESKRAGRKEHLEVTLPYSKERFSVPDNVYLIGTMNTADRSLAGLDIALRRRFVFREMPPRPDLLKDVLVQGLNIGQLLEKMNQRIEVLLDRDHALGHAYFMPLKDDSSLARLELIFRNQILPLLQEYFFEDWQRIGWVLNDQNASANGTAPFIRRPQSELNLADLFGSGVAEKLTDQRWELNHQAFSSLASYQNIVG